jgi:hypothetical protein
MIGVVTQGLANFPDGGVQTHIEINKGVGRPYLLLQVFPCYDSAGVGQQLDQHAKRLLLQLDSHAIPAQLTLSFR